MPELTIGDKTVTVGPEFLQLSPADQNATVAHIAQQIGAGAPAAAAAEAPAAPVSVNDVARSAASGVPVVGGLLDKMDAATNAALAPVLNRFFKPEDQLQEPNFSDRMAHSLRDQQGADKRFATDHPIVDTTAKLAGGVASMVPVMAAAPAAFGLAGPMSTMVRNGAASGAALSAADAAVRGEDVAGSALTGGIIGGAAGPVGKGVGKVVSAVADRFRPAPVVPQNVARVGNVDVPLSESQVTQNPAASAEEQILLRGGRGDAAQETAQGFKDKQDAAINQARGDIGAGLDPSGATAGTAPQDAAERVASELIAQEQAKQAAQAGVHAGEMSPAQHGADLARSLNGGSLPAATPFDAAETLSGRLAAARDAAKADYRGKYADVAAQPGEFAPGSAAGFRGDVENGLRVADNPVSLDATNTPKSLQALKVIDENLNLAGPAAPKPGATADGPGAEHAQNVADIRAKFGDEVATAYERQKAAVSVQSHDDWRTAPLRDLPSEAAKFIGDKNVRATPNGNLIRVDPQTGDRYRFTTGGVFKSSGAADVKMGSDRVLKTVDDINQHLGAGSAAPAAPKAQSLLEFIASKGGLGPDAELAAIGGEGHTVNVEGVGRRKLVRQGGWPLDYAREAAEEAGYLRGDHNGTSTVNDLLDAMDAEMRGQKRFPEGFEGQKTKREVSALSEREQHEQDRHLRGFEDDLAAAGHGELGPDVKQRAVQLMAKEGADADTAVERALSQLEQEDNAVPHGAGFPGDSQPAPAAAAGPKATAAAEAPGSGFTMRDVEQVRKQLKTLHGDARRAMMAGGSGADVHALEHITDHFDSRVESMIAQGKFAGDGPAVLKMQQEARASFADYKAKFSKRGAGDEVGAAVEKILGKFSDTKATPDAVVNLAYGSAASPGGQMPVQIAQRITKIFGRQSEEFGAYKQGLFAHLRAGEPEKAAARIDEFLTGTKGRMLAQTVFEPGERAALARYADRLRGTTPQPNEPGAIGAAVRRITGADGGPPAPLNEVVNYLYGPSGKGAGRVSVPLAIHLKQALSAEGWSAVRQGMWEKLTNAGEGKIPFEAQALSQRLHEFLNESGSQLSTVLFSDKERKLMQQLASVYKQMIPVKGTTNPSGTAPMLAKIASGARHTLLPLLGFTHGGVPGAAVAYGLDKGLNAIGNAKSARNATKLFYGEQATRPVDPRFAKGLGLLSQGSTPAINQRRAR